MQIRPYLPAVERQRLIDIHCAISIMVLVPFNPSGQMMLHKVLNSKSKPVGPNLSGDIINPHFCTKFQGTPLFVLAITNQGDVDDVS
jgi:hypothetical protein